MNTRNGSRFLVVLLFALLWNFVFIVPGFFGQEDIKTTPNELLLYELDNDRRLHVAGVVPIDPALTVHQKLRILLNKITRHYYSDDRSLEALRTKKTKDGFIVTINLKEDETDFFRSKWYQAFQGELGAHQVFVQIFFNLLQPDYSGFWFSGMNVTWNGQPLFNEEMKDALDFDQLTGTAYRQALRSSKLKGLP